MAAEQDALIIKGLWLYMNQERDYTQTHILSFQFNSLLVQFTRSSFAFIRFFIFYTNKKEKDSVTSDEDIRI